MKANVLFAVVSVIGLAGCQMIEGAKILHAFGSDPVFLAAMKPGANKQSLDATGFTPQKSRATRYIRGTCSDYRLEKNGQYENLFVGFNDKNQVVSYGFNTCDAAEDSGSIRSSEPPKQVY